jgi:hypothetical protein
MVGPNRPMGWGKTHRIDLKSKMMQEIKEEIITKRQFLRGETIFLRFV